MGYESKNDGTNNSYPATHYGASNPTDASQFGSRVGGSGNRGKYTVEFEIDYTAGNGSYPVNLMTVALPAGLEPDTFTVYVEETLVGGTQLRMGYYDAAGQPLASGQEIFNRVVTDFVAGAVISNTMANTDLLSAPSFPATVLDAAGDPDSYTLPTAGKMKVVLEYKKGTL